MRVQQMTNNNGNKVNNQFIITDGSKVTFQSYDSTIATVDSDNKVVTIYPDYNYSNTTNKYRNLFFAEYTALKGLSSIKALRDAIEYGEYNGYAVQTA